MLGWLFGSNDPEKYAGRESASARATRKATEASQRRSASHRRSGATKADRRGQAWTDRQRYRA
jgi:hypothetical protein